jgi:NADH-ubiquinone oxidoreductase chain 1
VRIVLILIVALVIIASLNLNYTAFYYSPPLILIIFPISIIWFITSLAETARTPFDFAEGESELVSGFNTEFRGRLFAFIFIAEYINILVFRIITASLFIQNFSLFSPLAKRMLAITIATLFICIRASYPRIRYDRLIALTWKVFLPFSLVAILRTFSVLSIIT